MSKIVMMVAGGLIVAILAAVAYLELAPRGQYLSPAMLNVEGASLGGPFELTQHTGERITSDALIDRPTLIYFGYTFCPDICPIDVQVMADAVIVLEEKGIEVRPAFVTIDPARDTAEELAAYVEAMHPRMVGLTGSDEDIRAAADAYKVYYQRVDVEDSAAEYLMNHTGFTYLMMPETGIVAAFRNGFPPEQIAEDIEAVLSAL
ncbi:MAG: SCO family protein [Pseudomonadota bacterium]